MVGTPHACHSPHLERIVQLGERWQRARRSALGAVTADQPAADGVDDLIPIKSPAGQHAAAQRRVFDHSLQLGNGFRRFHDVALELDELPAALDQLAAIGAPCLHGTWTRADGDDALLLTRPGCPASADGPNACDWWREAISGLVLGLTGGLRHTRHHSRGHGADRCVDVFHADPQSPLRFGPIPAEMLGPLAAVARSAAVVDSSCRVEFLGLSEDVLYYQQTTSGCGGGNVRTQPLIERGVHRRFPQLSLCEVTPRPVLGDP